MGFLFENHLAYRAPGLPLAAAVEYLRNIAMQATIDLAPPAVMQPDGSYASNGGRLINRFDDKSVSRKLVQEMGGQLRIGSQPHASDYVENWRLASGNSVNIAGMVLNELDNAYALGIDTRSPVAIGRMLKIAAEIWSQIGDYTSPNQKEGPR